MAENPAPGKASAISGWTAFSNPAFVKSALANMQAMTATHSAEQSNTDTPVADAADTTIPISQANNNDLSDASPSDSEPSQGEKDEQLIADPPRLAGEALIDLARRFSTADIVDLSNTATGGNLTRIAINGRLNTALNKKAKALNTTKAKLKEELTGFRKARGIKGTRRAPNHRHSVVGEGSQVGGGENSEGGQAGVLKSEQAKKNVPTKTAPQADAAANTNRPKGENLTEEKENSDSDTGDASEDDESLAAQQKADHEAFQDQTSLKGEKILLLAERYSNADISARICGILGNYPLTENGVATRIHVALEKRAKATGMTTDQVRDDLNAARIASGAAKVTPRGRGIMRVLGGSKTWKAVRKTKNGAATRTYVRAKDGAKRTDAVKQSAGDDEEMEPPKKRARKTHESMIPVTPAVAAEGDAEVTNHGSAAGSQDGYDADEVGVANTLLETAAGGPEVREAATILMDMHGESAVPGGQSDQSGEVVEDDSEMNDL